MESLPIPCPAHLIPDATGVLDAVYRQARAQRRVFIAMERQGSTWTVKADTLTAGRDYQVDGAVNDVIRDAVLRLIAGGEVRSDAYTGPVYFVLDGMGREGRAREIAAGLDAALHGDVEPLLRTVP
ncbi:hypothetical protein ACWC3X_44225 [Streptomyces populi]